VHRRQPQHHIVAPALVCDPKVASVVPLLLQLLADPDLPHSLCQTSCEPSLAQVQMNAVRQKCRPKHQVLVLKCYPKFQKNVQEVKPNSSELSYLLYYASTRRSKLQKVGAFLEKKTASDVWRLKLGYVDDCKRPKPIDTILIRVQQCPGYSTNPHSPDG
jgi:hypothetical protein